MASSLKGHHHQTHAPARRKHNHAIYVFVLLALTGVVFYTKRSSYFGTSWPVHDRYLETPPLRPTTEDEKKGGWEFTHDVYDYAIKHPNAKVISLHEPRLVHFPAFMTERETQHLMTVAKADLHRSEVVVEKGQESTSNTRTSFGMWPPHDDFMRMIEERIHRLVGIPHEFGEGMYVLRYEQGQEYKAHNDNCKGSIKSMPVLKSCQDFLERAGGPKCGKEGGGPSCGDRIATFIIVLDPPEEGGHTAFPLASATQSAMVGINPEQVGNIPWYCNAKYQDKVLQVSAAKGDGVLFWDYAPHQTDATDAVEVDGSQHSGCPVVKGEKWIVTRWIRSSEFI